MITRPQFEKIAPKADSETLNTLFSRNQELTTVLERGLTECKIIEPAVIAQFLACCSLATERFTQFHFGNLGVDVVTWLFQRKQASPYIGENGEIEQGRALSFFDFKLHEDAREWDWDTVVDHCAVTFPIPTCYWNDVHSRLAEVCAAIGIEDLSEKFAIAEA